ncbi:transcription factor Adf-1 [Parasteatoda tepidariorum]|uniref:transcription factor Adf-1 n=1 Tax=Parasteatoda tepidariorum TaxID=114398 RepID=UPI00077F8BE0|nr:uncharacterized protein LOC107437145 [Parasteatoda tepidariorum]XP_042907449.1 uncharacterized protein LOC107437145 [Parasteatoda tepidariorum]
MSSLPYISEVICASRKLNSERREIDNEKLINELRSRPGLWDQGSYEYGNRLQKVKHWEAVAAELNRSVTEVKSRWKLLKDSFNREIRNMARGGHSTTKWVHFDQMSFLMKGTNSLLLPRVNFETESDSGYLSQSMFEVDSESQNTTSNSAENELSENSYITIEDIEAISPKKKKRKVYYTSTNNKGELSNPICAESPDEKPSFHLDPSNEDYLFLTSLLPTLERLSAKKKMLFKIKLMQNLFEAAYGEETSNANCSNDENISTV